MNPFSYLKSLFAALDWTSDLSKPEDVVVPPAPPKPELSCLIKGIAQAWIDGKGWKVTRRSQKGVCGTTTRWAVTLRHDGLDITITFTETGSFPSIDDIHVKVAGQVEASPFWGYWSANSESYISYHHIHQTILSHPYPALKRRMTEQARREAIRADKTKAIEALGCPTVNL